jgi:hypothetical protein
MRNAEFGITSECGNSAASGLTFELRHQFRIPHSRFGITANSEFRVPHHLSGLLRSLNVSTVSPVVASMKYTSTSSRVASRARYVSV